MKSLISQVHDCVLGDTGDTEIEQYLNVPLIPFHHANSYLWWRENRYRFVQLAELVRQYLVLLPTSVASERLCSTSGDIYDEKRNHLASE